MAAAKTKRATILMAMVPSGFDGDGTLTSSRACAQRAHSGAVLKWGQSFARLVLSSMGLDAQGKRLANGAHECRHVSLVAGSVAGQETYD